MSTVQVDDDFRLALLSTQQSRDIVFMRSDDLDCVHLVNSVSRHPIYEVMTPLVVSITNSEDFTSTYVSELMHFPVHIFWEVIQGPELTYHITIAFRSEPSLRPLRLAYTLLRISDSLAFQYPDPAEAIDMSYAITDDSVVATVIYDNRFVHAYNEASSNNVAFDSISGGIVTIMSTCPGNDLDLALMSDAISLSRLLKGSHSSSVMLQRAALVDNAQ